MAPGPLPRRSPVDHRGRGRRGGRRPLDPHLIEKASMETPEDFGESKRKSGDERRGEDLHQMSLNRRRQRLQDHQNRTGGAEHHLRGRPEGALRLRGHRGEVLLRRGPLGRKVLLLRGRPGIRVPLPQNRGQKEVLRLLRPQRKELGLRPPHRQNRHDRILLLHLAKSSSILNILRWRGK